MAAWAATAAACLVAPFFGWGLRPTARAATVGWPRTRMAATHLCAAAVVGRRGRSSPLAVGALSPPPSPPRVAATWFEPGEGGRCVSPLRPPPPVPPPPPPARGGAGALVAVSSRGLAAPLRTPRAALPPCGPCACRPRRRARARRARRAPAPVCPHRNVWVRAPV